MAKLNKQERERLVRLLRAAGEDALADKIRTDDGREPVRLDDGLRIRSLRLHTATLRLSIGDRTVGITPTVAELLTVLSAMAGLPVGRHELAELLEVPLQRLPAIVTQARKALNRLVADGRSSIQHDPADDAYWLAPTNPLLVVA